MELGPPSWRTLVVFSCRLLHKMHEFWQPKLYCVPKVRTTTHLKHQILRLTMVRISLKLYRYQHTPEKVASVKGKVSISFTSGFRLVNVYRYQIVLQPLIDTMLFAWVLQEFQNHTVHTQDVRNWNQGYQHISPDLYFTRNSTCQNSDWASAETHQEETDTILTLCTKLIVSMVLVQHCTVLYSIANINLK